MKKKKEPKIINGPARITAYGFMYGTVGFLVHYLENNRPRCGYPPDPNFEPVDLENFQLSETQKIEKICTICFKKKYRRKHEKDW
jgi:hypothetical protein